MNHIDLFSGIGGFALAAKWAGFKTRLFCENDKFCQLVLAKNFPNVPICNDIKDLCFKGYNIKFDLLTGGFPCQPFSTAGKKKGRKDERHLWPEMLRVINECYADWIIAENVNGIVAMELDNIIDDLEKSGYETQTFVIPACSAGAPHKRDRVWIIANRLRDRCNGRINNYVERDIQDDINRDIQANQKKWKDVFCKSWQAFNAQDWLGFAAHSNCLTSEQTNKRTESIETERDARLGHSGQDRINKTIIDRKEDQSAIPRVDDGLPDRFHEDRNKALGNAIVPQVVYPIMAFINAAARSMRRP